MTGARVSKLPPDDAPQHVRVIMAIRRKHHWTQKQFAWELGVHVNTVKRWEASIRQPHPAWMRLIVALETVTPAG